MKILMAILVNSFFSFLGFVLFLILFRPREGWMATSLYDWLKISAVISLFVSIPVGIINGWILEVVKNSVIAAILLALCMSLLLAVFLLNAVEYNQLGIYREDIVKIFVPAASLFTICLICNIATVYLLKWKFPNSL
jgi:hypothetical protein